ncbi:MAG TPA: ferritin-like domain-containing protein [Solirubrobacteraceae bacterium]|nr:ferritin-like domain-containing protein [Solirubrobacteraceae bacterium]
MNDSALRELADDQSSRKRFFKMLGGAGAVGAASVLIAACGDDDKTGGGAAAGGAAAKTTGDNTSDLEIVNYALTLEFLEATFYQEVLDSGVVKDPKVGDLAKTLQEQEQEHVDALTATAKSLGGTPATKPKTKFQDVIAKGPKAILETAATVENLGAAAYLGQAGNIKSKDILAAALSIHSVEARHAAALNELVGRGFGGGGGLEGSLPDGAFAKPMDMAAVLKAVKPFLAS